MKWTVSRRDVVRYILGSGNAGWESCPSLDREWGGGYAAAKFDGCYLALQTANNASLPGTSFIVNSSLENIVLAIYKVGCRGFYFRFNFAP